MNGLLETIWLVEEAQETLTEFRKAIKGNEPLDLDMVKEELSDTLIAAGHVANSLGFDLDEVAKEGVAKQKKRFQDRNPGMKDSSDKK